MAEQANQQVLFKVLRLLFPYEKIYINTRKATQLHNPSTMMYGEVDIWCKNLGLCFEFQDIYHYTTAWYSDRSTAMIAADDYIKSELIRTRRMELVIVPCWWDGQVGSLQSTIHFQLPHLLAYSNVPAISLNPPSDFFKSVSIPGVNTELMNVSFLLNSTTLKRHHWWLGEKYDGIRFCYSGTQLYSRQGAQLYLPCVHYNRLPKFVFEGEIWFGRANYVLAHQMIFKHPEFDEYLRMIVFDYPQEAWQHIPVELRVKALATNISDEHPFIVVPLRMLLPSTTAVERLMKCVTDNGGEGVVLQQHGSPYVPGRSQSMLKFKITTDDKEGLVVRVTDVSVSLKLPSGRIFTVPMQNVVVPRVAVGDIVTFSSESIYKHTPVHATVHRKRVDLTWKDVVNSASHYGKYLGCNIHDASTSLSTNEMRAYLESYAAKQLLDPANPKTWHLLQDDILSTKHGRRIVEFYGSYFRAVQQLFPEASFDNANNGTNIANSSRKVFESVAKTKGFNPTIAHNWYNQSRADLMSFKAIDNIVTNSFGNNLPKALVSLFPELDIDVTKLFSKSRCWSDPAIQRKQFVHFALTNGFDPLCAAAWYSQKKLRHYPGVRAIMRYHKNNLINALIFAFPNIGLRPTLFYGWRKWQDPNARRQFFLDYAAKVGVDPLQATSWHSQSLLDIRNTPGGESVVSFHAKSVAKALVDLFPNIEFSKRIFTKHK